MAAALVRGECAGRVVMKWGDSAAWSEVDGIRWLRGLIGQLGRELLYRCFGSPGLGVTAAVQ